MARPVLAGPRPIQCNQWPPGQRHLVIIIILMFIIIILDIIHIIITIIITNITCMIILFLFITIIRVSPPLCYGPYNAINGQVSILQSNTTCQTTEMQTQGWKNQMESFFCLSLKRPVSHKGQRMCKTSLRPAAAMSEVNMKRVQAGVSPPLFRAGPIARHRGAADVSHLKYWSSAREAFSTSKHLGRNPEYSELPSSKI